MNLPGSPTPLPDFRWDDLVDLIIQTQVVVPVIGDGVITAVVDGTERPFSELLAENLAQALTLKLEGRPSLRAVAGAALRHGTPQLLRSRLFRVHEDLLQAIPNDSIGTSARLLAQITDFPLVLTTATHGFLERAYAASSRIPKVVSLATGDWDLPPDWQPSREPTLVHLFGGISRNLKFDVTEEDLLETLWALQKDRRPERLLDALCPRNLLFIGNRFPDWLSRIFMRSMRRSRLSDDRQTIKALAEDSLSDEPQLVLFLESLGQQTWIYRGGDVADFVRTLHERWSSAKQSEVDSVSTTAVATPQMQEGAVFVSYFNKDKQAARQLSTLFDQEGLDAWFDEDDLRGGDAYDRKIQRGIERCTIFVALISENTESVDEAYFRREWRWALERAQRMAEGRRFIVPLIIDDSDPKSLSTVPDAFRRLTIEHAPRGQLSAESLRQLVEDVRSIRARNARA